MFCRHFYRMENNRSTKQIFSYFENTKQSGSKKLQKNLKCPKTAKAQTVRQPYL